MMHTFQTTQSLADLESLPLHDDARFPRSRLRKTLRRYRYRGEALKAEVERIMRGPGLELAPVAGRRVTYPYGWQKHQMTRLMKRIFHGLGREQLLFVDEFWLLHGQADMARAMAAMRQGYPEKFSR
ncbi:hypothetical protein K1144_004258 [Salmonella enterica]|nr:hypothetical protein [Salmonella enterica]EHY0174087.1 hypothetical protein [Salmonella enterica]EIX0136120.1 hypothetical protein [Escherichia coli]ELM8940424.1 hypothetical protein [Escherichia coli]HDV3698299.1 hypothetical protein [Escherichia coli]